MTENFDFEAYSKNMRLALSDPHHIDGDGKINHQYFLVKKGTYWSESENQALFDILSKYPIGEFSNRDVLKNFV